MPVPTLHHQHQCKLETTSALHYQSVHEVEVLLKIAYFFQAEALHYQSVHLVEVLPKIAYFSQAERISDFPCPTLATPVRVAELSKPIQMVLVTSGFPLEPDLQLLLLERVQASEHVLAK